MFLDDKEKRKVIASLSPMQQRALLEKARQKFGRSEDKTPVLDNREVKSTLSYAQRAIWLYEQLNPGSSTYNVSLAYQFSGIPDIKALHSSMATVVARHAVLRSAFPNVDGRPYVRIADELIPELRILDLGEIALEGDRFEEMSRAMREFHVRPFSLDEAPLLRGLLIRLDDAESILAFSLHHSVCDGASLSLFLQELGEAYHAIVENRAPAFPSIPAQYADFVQWQNDWLSTADAQQKMAYWKAQLKDLPVTQMQMQRNPQSEEDLSLGTGARTKAALKLSTSVGIATLAAKEETTQFAILLTALNVLVGRYCGADDVVIGAPFEGRTQAKFENLIGLFINPLPLRTDISGEPTFRELIRRVKKIVIDALQNQSVPLDKILAEVRPPSGEAQRPLFQIFLNRYQLPESVRSFPELSPVIISKEKFTPKFDLTLFLGSNADSASITAIYNRQTFSENYIHLFLKRLLSLLDEVVVDPDLPISTYLPVIAVDKHNELSLAGAPPSDCDSINDAFERVTDAAPNEPAIIDGASVTTYGELRARKEAVRESLTRGIGNVPRAIGVMSNSDVSAISGILGVLAAGCYFVPLDPTYPEEKLIEIVKACELGTVLASDAFASQAQHSFGPAIEVINLEGLFYESNPTIVSDGHVTSTNAKAYILFTSGSTGRPKGVVQSDVNLMHHALTYAKSISLQKKDRVSLLAWFGFDAGIMDIFGALLTGAAIVPLRLRELSFAAAAKIISDQKVTVLHPTPTVFRYVAKALGMDFKFLNVRVVVLGGEEALVGDFELFRRHFVDEALLINGLGPSESTLALQYRMDKNYVPENGTLPAGFPVAQTEVVLMNRHGQEVGLLAPGEIVIKSRHVALGYHGDVEQTERVFSREPTRPGVW
ncbi:condensation domain-containing protein, partial [Polaromonas sp. P5_E6]